MRRADAEADRKARFVAWDCLHQFATAAQNQQFKFELFERQSLPWLTGLLAGAVAAALAFSYMRLSKLVTGTRPLLGATVAIPVLVFIQAGYVKFAGFEETQAILAFCFLAGFSERWFLGLMERFESGKK